MAKFCASAVEQSILGQAPNCGLAFDDDIIRTADNFGWREPVMQAADIPDLDRFAHDITLIFPDKLLRP